MNLMRRTILAALLLQTPLVFAHSDLHLRIHRTTEAIRKDPGKPELYLKRGELHYFHEDYPKALADMEQALKLKPDYPAALLIRAHALKATGKREDARKSVDQLLEKHPEHNEAMLLRARLKVEAGDKKAAVDDYSKVIPRLTERLPEVYAERAQAQADLGKDHISAAIAGLDEGLSRVSGALTLQLLAIELELKRSDFEGALRRVDSILATADRKESWHYRRGEILELAGRKKEATEAFAAAAAALDALPERLKKTPPAVELKQKLAKKR